MTPWFGIKWKVTVYSGQHEKWSTESKFDICETLTIIEMTIIPYFLANNSQMFIGS